MKQSNRIWLAAGSLVLSLPAYFSILVGAGLTFSLARMSGFSGTPLQGALNLLHSWQGAGVTLALLLLMMHIALFSYLQIRFARGLALPGLAQWYCLCILVLAIGERIRLQIVDGNVFFWFGLFSLPHALCLLALIYANGRPRKTIPA